MPEGKTRVKIRMLVGVMVVAVGTGCPVDGEQQGARDGARQVMPTAVLGDPENVALRAEVLLDQRLAQHPQDAEYYEELLEWQQDQLEIDDMLEAEFREQRYGFGMEEAR